MDSLAKVQQLALDLPAAQRAALAVQLLDSLPPILQDPDEGVAEALRRDAELEANPALGLDLEQLDRQFQDRSH